MLQQFASDSDEAGKLLGKLAKVAGVAGVLASVGQALNTAIKKGPQNVPVNQMTVIAASVAGLFGTAATAPMAGLALGVLAAGLTIVGWETQNSKYTVGNALQDVRDILQPYYSQLSSADQAEFTNSLSDTLQATLSGAMMVPRVDDSGWITGYSLQIPTSTVQQADGSTRYTFDSGVTYIVGTVADDGPLKDPKTSSAGKNVWTIPQPDTNTMQTFDLYQDGCYTSTFIDADGDTVTEVFITGSSSIYTVAPPTPSPTGGNAYQFVYVVGTDDQITIHGDNNCVSLTDGNHAIFDGANNTVHASAGVTVEFGQADGNTIYNDMTGENISISDGIVTVSGDPNGDCGGATVNAGATNTITIKADGSQDLVVKYDGDDTTYRRTYNAANVMTAFVITSPDGFHVDTLYDAVTGRETEMTFANANGSGSTYKFNSNGQQIETFNFNADGSGRRLFTDPLTHGCTGINEVHADGSETIVYRSPGSLTMSLFNSSHTMGETMSAATQPMIANSYDAPSNGASNAYTSADRQAAQLIEAMAAYAPESSASMSLAAIPPENTQLLLAASAH
ncbi:hypothetical protein PQR75_25370 [Paraburkholderia fungorum]|uniref:hypothetical protein n=1 Tax=Paraburkholderia fungorum TaxID=134537 RepID=UPI0038BB66E2